MEISNLPVAEFKTLVIRMLKELRGGTDGLSENYNKDIRSIKKEIENIKQSEMQNTVTEVKTTLRAINSRVDGKKYSRMVQ